MYPAEYLTYGLGRTAALTVLPSRQKRYAITDHLGSARVVLDSSGMVVNRVDYDPDGNALPLSGAVTGARKGYIDRERDAETGLLNTGVRQLDGARFTSVDPLWEKYPSLSPYAYTASNPLNFIDRNGKELTFYRVDENGEYVIDSKSATEGTLKWAPNGGMTYEAHDENLSPVDQRLSPALGLIHEGDHAYRAMTDYNQYQLDNFTADEQYHVVDEHKATEAEFRAGNILHHLEHIRPDHKNYIDRFEVVRPWSNVPQNDD
jgi:RHS repeat-associated protein